MLIYIIKSAACLAILFLFYKLFLERENMHVFKRFYLLGALLFALTVPAIIFTEYVVVEPQVYEAPLQTPSVMVESTPNIPPALEADVTDIAPLLWIVYFIGLFFFGIKFLRNLFQIFRRISRNPKYKKSSFIQVLLQEKIPPHTFFKYIFLNKSKFESKEIPKEVILHEETHAKQKHSLDVVFIELLQVIFWVNPLIYFFKKAIKLNHEFLADSAVLKKNVDAVTYQNTLLSFLSSESAKKYQPSLPNAINYSSIKKRFKIMKSKTSKKSIVLRSFLLLPLLALLLVGFTETKLIEIAPEVEKPTEKFISSGELIQISINGKGQLLIENDLVLMQDLDSFILKLKHDLLREKGTEIVRAKIIVNDDSPENIIVDVQRALSKHDIAQIDIIGQEAASLASAIQEGATEEQVAEYNALAKKYYELPVGNMMAFYRTTNSKGELENELKRLEHIYTIMTDKQKANAEPYFTIPSMPESSKLQEGATKEQIKEYNTLAKKYNAVAIEERKIPGLELAVLELAYRNMSPKQKKLAQPFPECLPQEGAMKVQLQEYNVLAKRYNSMIVEEENIWIKKGDVDRLEYLHGLMTEEQKADAEPFPDFPEPPPPPAAPEEIEEDMLEMEHEMASQEEAMKEKEGAMIQKEHAMREKQLTKKQQSNDWTVTSSAMRDSRKLTTEQAEAIQESPIPPVTPTIAVLANTDKYSKELKSSIDAYLKKNKNYEKAVAAFSKKKNGDGQDLWNIYNETMELYVNYHFLAKKEGNFVQPVPAYNQRQEKSTTIPNSPPAPPKPESPIDHIIKMAKQDAIFYYKREKITSDEAIAILKKNKKLSISTTKNNDERPVVKIVKHL